MATFSCLQYLLIAVLICQIQSLTVVNNVTVSSDVLSDLFFNAIRNNLSQVDTSAHDTKNYNSLKCISSLREMGSQFPALKVLPFFDAWGKFPSGILGGNLFSLGNYDQCVKTSATLSSATGLVKGQYCFASIPLIKDRNLHSPINTAAKTLQARDTLSAFLQIAIAICVPDSCSPELLTYVFQSSASNVFYGALSGITVSKCKTNQKPEPRTIDDIAIVFYSIFAGLMIASSIYDFMMSYFGKLPIPVLLAFSILTNGKKLFAINTTKSPNSIDCLTGIRVFSMIWVIYGHTFSTSLSVPLVNLLDLYKFADTAWGLHLFNATISVDAFFFISGVLVAWLGFRELDRTKGRLNVGMMYLHRYIRLTPMVAASLFFLLTLNKLIGRGPFREDLLFVDGCNSENWWPVLLYIQNYFITEPLCFSQTWYLAIDFQLYILSPFLLVPIWKWGKKYLALLPVLAILSIGCVMATYLFEGYTDTRTLFNEGEWRKTYAPTHTRLSPWLVGFGLGYFMYINRGKKFHLSKILQLVGWIVSFTIFASIVFAPYFSLHNQSTTALEAATYESLKRVSWAIALAWITFACHFGFGGVVDAFLSHPFWQPLGRLTYSLYLVHLPVLGMNFGGMRTEVFFSNYNEILYFWSGIGTSLIAAIAMTLAFESPIMVLEKAIFGRGKASQNVT